jgi:hypothetical protein
MVVKDVHDATERRTEKPSSRRERKNSGKEKTGENTFPSKMELEKRYCSVFCVLCYYTGLFLNLQGENA